MPDDNKFLLISQATGAVAVEKSDETVIAPTPRGLFVGTGGHLAVEMSDGTTETFKNIQSGTLLGLRVTKVLAATTAADILALY